MKKNYNIFYVVKDKENIDQIAQKCGKNVVSILIKNEILPKDVKKSVVLFLD